jgi:hypothetical protein
MAYESVQTCDTASRLLEAARQIAIVYRLLNDLDTDEGKHKSLTPTYNWSSPVQLYPPYGECELYASVKVERIPNNKIWIHGATFSVCSYTPFISPLYPEVTVSSEGEVFAPNPYAADMFARRVFGFLPWDSVTFEGIEYGQDHDALTPRRKVDIAPPAPQAISA